MKLRPNSGVASGDWEIIDMEPVKHQEKNGSRTGKGTEYLYVMDNRFPLRNEVNPA